MYKIGTSHVEEILSYHDIFDGNIPDLNAEINKLNMHKAISIICELINAVEYRVEVKAAYLKLDFPFETVLKKVFLGIDAKSPKEMFSNPLLHKDKHIIAPQTLLILLKKVIAFGDYNTLTQNDYLITAEDYKNIIILHLLVAEETNQQFEEDTVDMNHFIYANYHFNRNQNVASEFLRSYYMFETISRDRNNFDDDIQKEYRDYYNDFSEKYGYTITQYLSLLFWELSNYCPPKNTLVYQSIWRNVEKIYGCTAMKDVGNAVITDLSKAIADYKVWSSDTENKLWDFSKFNEYPFLVDRQGNYISISEYTLKNTFYEKLYWHIRACYPQKDSRAMAFYGRLHERYIQALTKNAVDNSSILDYIPEFKYGENNDKSSDAYIKKSENLLIVEAKGYSILLNSLINNEDMQKNNNKLFIEPIIQADKTFSKIDEIGGYFDGITTVYIISVTMDSVNAIPKYLHDIHSEIFTEKKSSKTKYIFNFNIEEYEMLMYLVEKGINIFDVLANYFESEYILPFSTYLNENVRGKIELTTFMETVYKEACKTMMSLYNIK